MAKKENTLFLSPANPTKNKFKKVLNFLSRHKKGVLLSLLPLLLLFLFWQTQKINPPKRFFPSQKIKITSLEDIAIVPTKKTKAGVAPNTSFLLTSKIPLTNKQLFANLKIIPQTEFAIKQKEKGKWEIKPKENLTEGKVYKIVLSSLLKGEKIKELSWAFQVKTPFRVSSSLPADKATNVPLDTSIEIYFNNPNFKIQPEYLETTPKIEGKIKKQQNALIFLPKKLEEETIYTVRIKKGFSLEDGSEKIQQDFVFAFETQGKSKKEGSILEFYQPWIEAKPEEEVYIPLNTWEGGEKEVLAKIYRLSDHQFEQCLGEKLKLPNWSLFAYQKHRCRAFLSEHSQVKTKTKKPDSYSKPYLEFPPLEKGFYLFDLEAPQTGEKSQLLVEVTPISWFRWFGYKQSLVWLNNLEEQKPQPGFSLYFLGERLGETNQEGVATFATPKQIKEKEPGVLVATKGKEKVFIPTFFEENYYFSSPWIIYPYSDSQSRVGADSYYSYLYLDRNLYLPSETVNFWGLIRSRNGQELEEIKAKLIKGYFDLWNDKMKGEIVKEKTIKLSSNLTFKDKFDLSGLPTGSYSILIFDKEDFVVGKTFQVETFQKPVYKIKLEPEKLSVWAGETNKIKIKAQFWDKSPASYVTFSYNTSAGPNKSGEIQTNKRGEAEISIPTTYNPQITQWPQIYWVQIKPKHPEEGEIYSYTSFWAFGPEIKIKTKSERDPNKGRVWVKTVKINLDQLQKNPWSEGKEAVANIDTKLKVYRTWYEKKEVGEEYDPIEKKVIKKYDFSYKEEKIWEKQTQTNQEGEAFFEFDIEPEQGYKIEVTATDKRGRKLEETFYLGGYRPRGSTDKNFTLSVNKEKLRIGEKINIQLWVDQSPAPTQSPNRYLLLGTQNGRILWSETTTSNKAGLKFKKEFVPNILVDGVWFDGRFYRVSLPNFFYPKASLDIGFDQEEKRLKLAISLNKEKYKPQEEATVKIKVTDKDGNPKRAKVLISLVDESLSDLGALETPNILDEIYRHLGKGTIQTYISHPKPEVVMADGGGGGGGGREEFKNTVVFEEVQTNKKGEAEVKFKFPDNLTSWRATVLAVTENLEAGETQKLIQTSLPFFLKIVTNKNFVVGDKPKISVSAFGDSLKQNQQVAYEMEIKKLGFKEKKTQKAFLPVEFELPKLEKEGEYLVEVSGYFQGKKDKVVKKIKVERKRLVKEKVSTQTIKEKEETTLPWQNKGIIKLIISSEEKAKYYPILSCLRNLCYSSGSKRSDQLIAQALAVELLKKEFSEESPGGIIDPDAVSSYLTQDGFKLLPHGSGDLVLSAKIAATKLGGLDKASLKNYFWEKFEKTDSVEEASAALWGLAELEEPVLNLVEYLFSQENTKLGKIYLGLAASALGNQTLAREVLDQLLNQFGSQEGNFVYLKIGDSKKDYLTYTSLAAVLAERVGSDFSHGLFEYTTSNPIMEEIFPLEKALWIKEVLRNTKGEKSKIEYYLDDKRHQETLADETLSLLLTPQQVNSFRIKALSGKVGLVARYWEAIETNNLKKDKRLKISIVARPLDKTESLWEFVVGFRKDPTALSGPYQIVVNLPSSFRFINSPYRYLKPSESYNWPTYIENNRLIFTVYKNTQLRFLARVVNRGFFVFEPALVYHPIATETTNISADPPDISLGD